jgi:hypothetical protein
VSDQDFFFDEEESAEEQPKKKSGSGSAKKSTPAKQKSAKSAANAADVPFMERTVTMTIAMLMAVVTLLVGVIVGIVIPTDSGVPAPTATGVGGAAPELTPEQLNTGMPEGHPDIGGMGGGEAPPAGMGEVAPEEGATETTEGAE